jgi:hypothetical protein
MPPVTSWLLLGSILGIAGSILTSETERVGGSGGRRMVTMDCGAGSYVVGATASGGKDAPPFGFSLVHRVKLTCRAFTNGMPAASTTQTVEAAGDKSIIEDLTYGSGICPSSHAVRAIQVNAGFYIDRLTNLACAAQGQTRSEVWLNVGGSSGTRGFLECPAAEALYKVEARVGDAIDSLKGYCRPFDSSGQREDVRRKPGL